VTLTTVGYGDIVPKTTTGRFAGVMIMVTGIGVLGLLAGSMASFFGLASGGSPDEAFDGSTDSAEQTASGGTGSPQALVSEVAALREQVGRLVDEVARLRPGDDASTDNPPR
jgi:voltage-gated potassium channel